ncbi:proteophosphoglycan related [Cystoisospora suis]|uniref:Proteophosphoglycan related n=1 Tax=Cystoisospora suis TaxID=483139 RepID=A0A2C6KIM1_9APIC|nr:proteophosphoglycan related [Cystoisospora suis]
MGSSARRLLPASPPSPGQSRNSGGARATLSSLGIRVICLSVIVTLALSRVASLARAGETTDSPNGVLGVDQLTASPAVDTVKPHTESLSGVEAAEENGDTQQQSDKKMNARKQKRAKARGSQAHSDTSTLTGDEVPVDQRDLQSGTEHSPLPEEPSHVPDAVSDEDEEDEDAGLPAVKRDLPVEEGDNAKSENPVETSQIPSASAENPASATPASADSALPEVAPSQHSTETAQQVAQTSTPASVAASNPVTGNVETTVPDSNQQHAHPEAASIRARENDPAHSRDTSSETVNSTPGAAAFQPAEQPAPATVTPPLNQSRQEDGTQKPAEEEAKEMSEQSKPAMNEEHKAEESPKPSTDQKNEADRPTKATEIPGPVEEGMTDLRGTDVDGKAPQQPESGTVRERADTPLSHQMPNTAEHTVTDTERSVAGEHSATSDHPEKEEKTASSRDIDATHESAVTSDESGKEPGNDTHRTAQPEDHTVAEMEKNTASENAPERDHLENEEQAVVPEMPNSNPESRFTQDGRRSELVSGVNEAPKVESHTVAGTQGDRADDRTAKKTPQGEEESPAAPETTESAQETAPTHPAAEPGNVAANGADLPEGADDTATNTEEDSAAEDSGKSDVSEKQEGTDTPAAVNSPQESTVPQDEVADEPVAGEDQRSEAGDHTVNDTEEDSAAEDSGKSDVSEKQEGTDTPAAVNSPQESTVPQDEVADEPVAGEDQGSEAGDHTVNDTEEDSAAEDSGKSDVSEKQEGTDTPAAVNSPQESTVSQDEVADEPVAGQDPTLQWESTVSPAGDTAERVQPEEKKEYVQGTSQSSPEPAVTPEEPRSAPVARGEEKDLPTSERESTTVENHRLPVAQENQLGRTTHAGQQEPEQALHTSDGEPAAAETQHSMPESQYHASDSNEAQKRPQEDHTSSQVSSTVEIPPRENIVPTIEDGATGTEEREDDGGAVEELYEEWMHELHGVDADEAEANEQQYETDSPLSGPLADMYDIADLKDMGSSLGEHEMDEQRDNGEWPQSFLPPGVRATDEERPLQAYPDWDLEGYEAILDPEETGLHVAPTADALWTEVEAPEPRFDHDEEAFMTPSKVFHGKHDKSHYTGFAPSVVGRHRTSSKTHEAVPSQFLSPVDKASRFGASPLGGPFQGRFASHDKRPVDMEEYTEETLARVQSADEMNHSDVMRNSDGNESAVDPEEDEDAGDKDEEVNSLSSPLRRAEPSDSEEEEPDMLGSSAETRTPEHQKATSTTTTSTSSTSPSTSTAMDSSSQAAGVAGEDQTTPPQQEETGGGETGNGRPTQDPREGRCTAEELNALSEYFSSQPEACSAYRCIDEQGLEFRERLKEHYSALYDESQLDELAGLFAACNCRCPMMKCEVDYVMEKGSPSCKEATVEYCENSNEKFVDRCTSAAEQLPLVYDIGTDPSGFKVPCRVCRREDLPVPEPRPTPPLERPAPPSETPGASEHYGDQALQTAPHHHGSAEPEQHSAAFPESGAGADASERHPDTLHEQHAELPSTADQHESFSTSLSPDATPSPEDRPASFPTEASLTPQAPHMDDGGEPEQDRLHTHYVPPADEEDDISNTPASGVSTMPSSAAGAGVSEDTSSLLGAAESQYPEGSQGSDELTPASEPEERTTTTTTPRPSTSTTSTHKPPQEETTVPVPPPPPQEDEKEHDDQVESAGSSLHVSSGWVAGALGLSLMATVFA